MGWKILVGLVVTVFVAMVVSSFNETAGGFAFLVGLVVTGIWALTA